ncbi:B3 domain-containing protein Os12g0592300-like isoform X1 [Andrographis paniculata]|uniref:B3 domain-containing protein Os12g0592300-like isoform X1 n=1 Tax=Andrographis paniculata TaxID=175694 RepID=UPI0021E8FB9A|nr:B3 domain-containing protein Os12g0592300-like isoform X1 [Andrographis paniculata]XP_051124790.1 B3 domain-containing protein Os12g0592300-like isoform X1 [Andrographis paniculata]XP_051124797.1 B3 domain-containing protein Os12g0592300-like isoform X1 [Andrographis paniculata]XP_051124806.1 B3 domain-containing protein Os12g0592300-like isoform X1 [Andrographis paniculata]XP_051124816.1 B3 domain-containing protein Os12g0592300-like isoform X1 [Andrographis paniculata]
MAYKRHEGSISHLTEKELSPSIPRFFHVLNDAHVLHALRLPSSFAPKVEHLVDQEILLEDLCGQIWPVTLSYVDNALSFALGWEIFYRDHALEGGCSLIFNYVGERHMSVQIYDPSGCERTCFTYPVRQLNNQNCYNVGVEEISEMGSAPRTAAMGMPQRKGVSISDIHNGFGKPMGGIAKEKMGASGQVILTKVELVHVNQEICLEEEMDATPSANASHLSKDPISPPPV